MKRNCKHPRCGNDLSAQPPVFYAHVAGSPRQRTLHPGWAAHRPHQSGRVRRKNPLRRSATNTRRNSPGCQSHIAVLRSIFRRLKLNTSEWQRESIVWGAKHSSGRRGHSKEMGSPYKNDVSQVRKRILHWVSKFRFPLWIVLSGTFAVQRSWPTCSRSTSRLTSWSSSGTTASSPRRYPLPHTGDR